MRNTNSGAHVNLDCRVTKTIPLTPRNDPCECYCEQSAVIYLRAGRETGLPRYICENQINFYLKH